MLEGYRWVIDDDEYLVPELEDEWNAHNQLVEKNFMLKKIILRVMWQSGNNDKELELVTLKMLYKKNE